jgi:predicted dehydrogenase
MKKVPTTRREFLRDTGVLAAAAAAGPQLLGKTKAFAQTANGKLGIGVIGCGGRARSHMDTLEKIKEEGAAIEIVAVCDVYRPRMEASAEKHQAKGYMDHRELLADPNVDIAAVITPDHLHAYQALDALKAEKHVYCEKPITHWRHFEVTRELNKAVKKSDRVFQVGAQGMSDPAWKKMKELVRQGLIGQPIHAECGYFRVGDWGERGMPVDDPEAKPGPDLNWDAFLGDSPQRPYDVSRFFRWRMYEDYSGGPATDLFPHSLSPVVDILGVSMPELVVATGGKFRYEEREVPDTFNMLIDYPEKITVAVLGTQGNDYVAMGNRGAPGRIPVIRGWEGSLTVQGEEVVFIPAEGSKKEAQRFPAEAVGDTKLHWKNLLDCIQNGARPNNPMDLAYHVQTALQMGVLGLRQGKVARFDALEEKILV